MSSCIFQQTIRDPQLPKGIRNSLNEQAVISCSVVLPETAKETCLAGLLSKELALSHNNGGRANQHVSLSRPLYMYVHMYVCMYVCI